VRTAFAFVDGIRLWLLIVRLLYLALPTGYSPNTPWQSLAAVQRHRDE
jgi:hypothetical protein